MKIDLDIMDIINVRPDLLKNDHESLCLEIISANRRVLIACEHVAMDWTVGGNPGEQGHNAPLNERRLHLKLKKNVLTPAAVCNRRRC